MNELPFINTAHGVCKELKILAEKREKNKLKIERKYTLTYEQRRDILSKTDSKCHMCGRHIENDKFEADHVKNHSISGDSSIQNFLPACRTCNNYRWHYSPEEIQWILKIGVWAKTKMMTEDKVGKLLAELFIKKEVDRENRRKKPRKPKTFSVHYL